MEFGNRHSFAVQMDLDTDYGGPWLFGRICYWISGRQVGDYELGTSLRDVLTAMRWIVWDCGRRDGENLCGLPPERVYLELDTAIYGPGTDGIEVGSLVPESPARFDISIGVDVFNGWKAFLLDCGETAVILFKESSDVSVSVARVAAGEFDQAIRQTQALLIDMLDAEEGERHRG